MCNQEKKLDKQLEQGKITLGHHYKAIAALRNKKG